MSHDNVDLYSHIQSAGTLLLVGLVRLNVIGCLDKLASCISCSVKTVHFLTVPVNSVTMLEIIIDKRCVPLNSTPTPL